MAVGSVLWVYIWVSESALKRDGEYLGEELIAEEDNQAVHVGVEREVVHQASIAYASLDIRCPYSELVQENLIFLLCQSSLKLNLEGFTCIFQMYFLSIACSISYSESFNELEDIFNLLPIIFSLNINRKFIGTPVFNL